MNKNDLLNKYEEYINSLTGNHLTDEELTKWIKKDSQEHDENLTECEIEWIVEEVRKKSEWYAVMDGSIEDTDWGTGSYDLDEALTMCKDKNDFSAKENGGRLWYVAVVQYDTCIRELDENGNDL